MNGCKVTLFHVGKVRGGSAWVLPTCDRPVVAHGLCEHHYAQRLRLGGAA